MGLTETEIVENMELAGFRLKRATAAAVAAELYTRNQEEGIQARRTS